MRKSKKEKEPSLLEDILGTIVYLLVVLVIATLFVRYVGQRTVVSGESMETTLQDGDNLVVDKLSYHIREPKRFEVVVFPYARAIHPNPILRFLGYDRNTYFIKRVIGLPGETIQILDDGQILIDGEVLEETYGREVIKDPGIAAEPITLGEDDYFVMGDNRNASADSRDARVGVIKGKSFVGRALVRIWPLNKMGFVRH